MNKYQEAFNHILGEIRMCRRNPERIEDLTKSLYLLQELVDKETPKKHYTKANMTNKICPSCHLIFGLDEYGRYEKHNHCPSCGQALDWSKYEPE